MPPEKVTKMVLDVDLNCSDCYKKVKKVICKIPEIRDQEYDVEKNKVKISVVCCSPEKIRDKLCYKGGSSIQKVEIVPDKPKEPAAKPKAKESEKSKGDDMPKPKAASPAPTKSDPSLKSEVAKMMFEPPAHGYPQMYPPTYPVVGYGYEGYGGPYGNGNGMPVATPQSSGYGYGYEYNHGYNGNYTSNYYFSEENPQGCSLM